MLPCVKQASSGKLLRSTGSLVRVECGGGREVQEGGDIYLLMADSHSYCCTAEINKTQESNYIPIEKYFLKKKKGKKEERKERRRKERALTIYYCRGGMIQ